MKKILVLLFIVVWWMPGRGQSISNQVIAVTGFSSPNGGNFLDFTVGELAVTTVGTGAQQITQGFHQSYTQNVSIHEAENIIFTVHVFPNPTADYVNITLEGNPVLDITAAVYDSYGKVLYTGNHPQAKTFRIDMQAWAAGSYYIRLSEKNTRTHLKTVPVQKMPF